MLKDSIDLAEAAAGRSLKRSEVSDYWSAKARAYISNEFRRMVETDGPKARLTFGTHLNTTISA